MDVNLGSHEPVHSLEDPVMNLLTVNHMYKCGVAGMTRYSVPNILTSIFVVADICRINDMFVFNLPQMIL